MFCFNHHHFLVTDGKWLFAETITSLLKNKKNTEVMSYQYISIPNEDRRLFCLQQNLVLFAWVLYFKQNTLLPLVRQGEESKTLRVIVGLIRKHLGRFRVRTRALLYFVFHKYYAKFSDSPNLAVSLPLYSQVCVPVHKGYKLFDFRREVVTKVFDENVSASQIEQEIKILKEIAELDFVPTIKRWNIEQRWYEEDYLIGAIDTYSSKFPLQSEVVLETFSSEVAWQLSHLMQVRKPIPENIGEYLHLIQKMLLSKDAASLQKSKKYLQVLPAFVESVKEELKTEESRCIYLVFSHGDFCPENMMHTKQGMKVIDWESATYRSALFDFYSYFFFRSASRKVPVSTMFHELQNGLRLFAQQFMCHMPRIAQDIIQRETVYRKLFYIERLAMLVEREKTDRNLDIGYLIAEYVHAFQSYENLQTECASALNEV